MAEYSERGVFQHCGGVYVENFASVVGKKEGDGPLGAYFDEIIEDSHFGKQTWEQAESRFQLEAVSLAVKKSGLISDDIDVICSGDLTNQCIGSSYGLRELEIPFLCLYGACSTMAEGIIISSVLAESGCAKRTAAVTSSHFSTAERQFRSPLSYGGQRTPTAQWTCTASGCVIISSEKSSIRIVGGCIGKIADMGINDITNMGSAMAPAAAETINRYLKATNTSPNDYDRIITGDLGDVGSALLKEIMQKQGTDISKQHCDCGSMIFDNEKQDTHSGGSGCGCSAAVLCGYILPKLKSGEFSNILFIATGALMSPVSLQQGESIPSVAHLVHFRKEQ